MSQITNYKFGYTLLFSLLHHVSNLNYLSNKLKRFVVNQMLSEQIYFFTFPFSLQFSLQFLHLF